MGLEARKERGPGEHLQCSGLNGFCIEAGGSGGKELWRPSGKIVSVMVEKQAGEETWVWERMERVMLMTERKWIDHLEIGKDFLGVA